MLILLFAICYSFLYFITSFHKTIVWYCQYADTAVTHAQMHKLIITLQYWKFVKHKNYKRLQNSEMFTLSIFSQLTVWMSSA